MCQTPSSASVGQTSGEIVAQNERRVGLFVRNMDDTKIIYLAFGHPAEVGKGFVLMPKEAFSMGKTDYSSEAVYAISSGDACPVAIQEFGLG